MSETEIKKSKNVLKKFDDYEENIKKIAKIKNELESIIY